jgi:hypothetical protein
MTSYLLDNNVISYFFNAGRQDDLARVAKKLGLVVVREVHEEAENHPSKGNAYKKWQPSSGIIIRDIGVGSDASAVLAQLQKNTAKLKDLGELASIALATDDPAVTFVSNDHGASWLTLNELHQPGERVIRFATFLQRAHDSVGLTRAAAKELAKKAQIPDRPPTWWQPWLNLLPK